MPDVSVEIVGLDQLTKRFKNSGDAIARYFTRAINTGTIMIQAEARKASPIDQGDLRKSIAVAPVDGLVGRVFVAAPGDAYAFWVHEGRKPGSFPPVKPIEEWAQRHGMPGAGFQIARKIAQKGIAPQPFFTQAVDAVNPSLPAIWKEAADAVIAELA